MIRRASLLFSIVVAAAALPALAAPGRYAITVERIAAAVSSSGVQVSPDQVTLFTGVVSSVADPELKVASIDRAGQQRAIARMECSSSQQCLPFVVALKVKDGGSIEIASTRPASPVSTFRPVTFAVRQGSTTALYLDGDHVHISLSVICLENGAPGQTIRATSQDRHQTYTVQVASNGTLRGRL
jgi:hypothetical protein